MWGRYRYHLVNHSVWGKPNKSRSETHNLYLLLRSLHTHTHTRHRLSYMKAFLYKWMGNHGNRSHLPSQSVTMDKHTCSEKLNSTSNRVCLYLHNNYDKSHMIIFSPHRHEFLKFLYIISIFGVIAPKIYYFHTCKNTNPHTQ